MSTDAISLTAGIQVGPYQITSASETTPFSVRADVSSPEEGVHELRLTLESSTPSMLPELKLEWTQPMADIHLRWITKRGGAIAIMPWRGASAQQAMVTSGAPVYALMSIDDTNRLTFALSDALNPSELRACMKEEDATLYCEAILESGSRATRTEYTVGLRIDTRPVKYHRALKDTADWWAAQPGYTPMPVPETARLPMYSTWYSFHLGITPDAIEEQCRLAKPLGMDAVIVDDGWQTEDCNRGYAYCGDWEMCESKFPDFKAHVKRVQDMGVKYMLWFSVPFVGIHSKAYERFKNHRLSTNPDAKWWCLDPRCPEVRDYLKKIYLRFVTEYGIDGLKLDFVDAFHEPKADEDLGPAERDNLSVAEAAALLMSEVADMLREAKPDIMLEFRQSYIGPYMRRCGNIFRVGDVPNDFHSNRINSLDLRLLSGETAVHSDMIMWHQEDSVESAALQLYHTLFSVPQISVLIDELPEDHRTMLATYLAFWREHQALLLDGDIRPVEPGMGYPQVHVRNESALLVAVYGATPIVLPAKLPDTVILVNGTMEKHLWIDATNCESKRWKLTATSCTGALQPEPSDCLLQGVQRLAVPPAGILQLERI